MPERMPDAMRAIRYRDYGAPDVLALEAAPLPVVGADEVLVRVRGASVNPADWKFRAGWFAQWVPLPMPFIPGSDFAGEVMAVGPLAAARFRPGDTVYGMRMPQEGGSHADYVAVRADALAPAPASIPPEQAAAVPLAALTAWNALFDIAGLKGGQTVVIQAAAGGVGSFAVQLAKIAGARVVALCSPAKAGAVCALGADETRDGRGGELADTVRDADVAIDAWGGEGQDALLGALRPGGVLVTLDPMPPDPARCARHGVRGLASAVAPNGARLGQLAALIDAGRLRVLVDHVFGLDEMAAAHARSESGAATGKIVIRL